LECYSYPLLITTTISSFDLALIEFDRLLFVGTATEAIKDFFWFYLSNWDSEKSSSFRLIFLELNAAEEYYYVWQLESPWEDYWSNA